MDFYVVDVVVDVVGVEYYEKFLCLVDGECGDDDGVVFLDGCLY